MNGHIYSRSVRSIDRIVSAVVSYINIFASDKCAHFRVFIYLLKDFTLLRFFVIQVDHIIGGTSETLPASQVFEHLLFNVLQLSHILIIHELPSFQVSFIFLHPIHLEQLLI